MNVASVWTGIVKSIQKALHDLPEAAPLMYSHGWYLDPTMALPDLNKVKILFDEKKVAEAEELLQAYFRKKLPAIESELCQLYPNRARFISLARSSHERGDYTLTVPFLLIQADGFCHDIAGASVFIGKGDKEKKRLQTADWAEKTAGANTLMNAVLKPFVEKTPIAFSQKEREPDFDSLYRHKVLHGESTDFDTELNALRAWSFLYYVGAFLKYKEHAVIAKTFQVIRFSDLIDNR